MENLPLSVSNTVGLDFINEKKKVKWLRRYSQNQNNFQEVFSVMFFF